MSPDWANTLQDLIACNADVDGRVIPRSTYQGWTGFSFGSERGPVATGDRLAAEGAPRPEHWIVARSGASDVL